MLQVPSYPKGRQSREQEKAERAEAQRKERELRNQQALEVSVINNIMTFFFFVCVKLMCSSL